MAPRKEDDEEKKRKKKEYDRLRREKIKNDPELQREQQLKERLKYEMKLKKKQVKPVKDMTAREVRQFRKKGRNAMKRYRQRQKHSENAQNLLDNPTKIVLPSSSAFTPQSSSSKNVQHIQNLAEQRRKASKDDMKKTIKALQEQIKNKDRIIGKLRKRETRAKRNTSDSPQSKVNDIMKNETSKQIARRVLFGESVRDTLAGYLVRAKKKTKRSFRDHFLQNARFLRKYRLLSELNFLSSRLFDRKIKDITNSRFSGIKLKRITEDVKMDVIRFFEDDENSIMCPGKRDCITRQKVKKQKRYLSGSMIDLHSKFCVHSGYKLSYSTFCRLKPFWVVPMKVSARNTCACKICDNMDLLVLALYRQNIVNTKKTEDLLAHICCDASSLACLERKCSNCKNLVIPYQPFTDGEVSYEQWTTVGDHIFTKNNVKKTVKHVAKKVVKSTIMVTVDLLEADMKRFMHHQAVKIHQFRAIKNLKARLTETEVLIHCDFSENYSMKYGREIQSVHFGGSRKQFTLHTVVIYFRKTEYEEVKFQSFCTLSSNNEHGPAAIWAHLQPVFDYIVSNLRKVETVHFQSDSPSSQYRNRTIFFLLSHTLQVFIPRVKHCTWNYSAPGHGKGAVDGIGGAMKRSLDKAVACGQDIADFDTFVKVLQEKSRSVLLYVITPEQIVGMANMIPRSIPSFKGTMNVYQVVYHRIESPDQHNVLQMNRLSCFNCLSSCDKFTIGRFEVDSNISPAREETNQLQSHQVETEIIEMDSQQKTTAASTSFIRALPQPGSYVLARFGELAASNKKKGKEFCYVSYIASVDDANKILTAHGLLSYEKSKREFTLNASDQFILTQDDIMMILPPPKTSIRKKKVLRVFPFDIEVIEK